MSCVCMGLYVFICIKFVYYILLVFLAICRTVVGHLDFTRTSGPYLIYYHCSTYDMLLSLSPLLFLVNTSSCIISISFSHSLSSLPLTDFNFQPYPYVDGDNKCTRSM